MVDAVNNNRDAVYTGIGAGAGLLAGGAYGGYFSKPLLNGNAPSDAFVRTYYDNDVKDQIAKAGADAKKKFATLIGEANEAQALKDKITAENAGKFGIEFEDDKFEDAKKAFFGEETDAAKLKEKMEKAYVDKATSDASQSKSGKELTKLKNAFEKLGENPDENAVKDFVKKHAEILGEKADGTSTITTKEALGSKVDEVIAPLANAKGKILEHFDTNDGLKKLADNASDDVKTVYNAVKKAAKETRLWAGAKWAVATGAVLGLASYIGSKMTAPKAPEEAPKENA